MCLEALISNTILSPDITIQLENSLLMQNERPFLIADKYNIEDCKRAGRIASTDKVFEKIIFLDSFNKIQEK